VIAVCPPAGLRTRGRPGQGRGRLVRRGGWS